MTAPQSDLEVAGVGASVLAKKRRTRFYKAELAAAQELVRNLSDTLVETRSALALERGQVSLWKRSAKDWRAFTAVALGLFVCTAAALVVFAWRHS